MPRLASCICPPKTWYQTIKNLNIHDIKHYLQVAPIARGGLLVVKIGMPFSPTRDCIVIPRYVIHGILTSLHIQLNHPSCHHQQTVVPRYFFALDMDKAIEIVSDNWFHRAALRKTPQTADDFRTPSCYWDLICCRHNASRKAVHFSCTWMCYIIYIRPSL